MDARYFRTPAEFGRWLKTNHAKAAELWVGYHKVGSGEPSLTWPQSVDEALCHGWIDGRRQRVDDERYRIRFTPRREGSIWSTVNLRRFAELDAEGRIAPAGRAAYEARRDDRTAVYSYERRIEELPPEHRTVLDANKAAATFFDKQPASYRRACCNWIVGAKQEATRVRRLQQLIELSERGASVPQFTRR
jgi:uncharacterized protein YdeI (YjbR/CyaY-like superfamily)